tara:strand:+ start:242 stop:526 length:285 start_codon:yes stop_codon:yes gene_type:complete
MFFENTVEPGLVYNYNVRINQKLASFKNVKKMDAKFQADAKRWLQFALDKNLLPPVNTWVWLENDNLRLYVFEDCVEFMTKHQTFQVDYKKVEA